MAKEYQPPSAVKMFQVIKQCVLLCFPVVQKNGDDWGTSGGDWSLLDQFGTVFEDDRKHDGIRAQKARRMMMMMLMMTSSSRNHSKHPYF